MNWQPEMKLQIWKNGRKFSFKIIPPPNPGFFFLSTIIPHSGTGGICGSTFWPGGTYATGEDEIDSDRTSAST